MWDELDDGIEAKDTIDGPDETEVGLFLLDCRFSPRFFFTKETAFRNLPE